MRTSAGDDVKPEWKKLCRSDRWLQSRLWLRRWQRRLTWLRLLDVQTFIVLGLVSFFGLSVLLQGIHALRALMKGVAVDEPGAIAPLVGGQLAVFQVSVLALLVPLLLAALAALRADPFRAPLEIDDFTVWQASQREPTASGYLLRQAVWMQIAWAAGGLGLGGMATGVWSLLGVPLPMRPGALLGLAAMAAAAVPGWSAALYAVGPVVTEWSRRLRVPIVVLAALLANRPADPARLSPPGGGWAFGSTAQDVVGTGTTIVFVFIALAFVLLPLFVISRQRRMEWERLTSYVQRLRKAATISNPEDRRLYLTPLRKNVVARRLSQVIYARGRWGLAVKNGVAWLNESPLQAVAALLGALVLPLSLPLFWQNPGVRTLVGPLAARLAAGLAAGEQGLWLYVAPALATVGTLVARLPRAGWRQEMGDPARRRWPGTPADYVAGAGVLSAFLALSFIVSATVVIGLVGGDPLFAAAFLAWALAFVPLWIVFALHEPWLDTLPAPPGMGFSPLQAGGDANMGLQAAIAFGLLPSFVLMFALAAAKTVYVALPLSGLVALLLAAGVWRWVQGAWPGPDGPAGRLGPGHRPRPGHRVGR